MNTMLKSRDFEVTNENSDTSKSVETDTSESIENSSGGIVIQLNKTDRKSKGLQKWPEPASACSYEEHPLPQLDLIISCEPKSVYQVKGTIASIKRANPPQIYFDLDSDQE